MPQAKIGVIGGTGLYDNWQNKNGNYTAPVISPWPLDDGEAAYNVIVPYIAYLSVFCCH